MIVCKLEHWATCHDSHPKEKIETIDAMARIHGELEWIFNSTKSPRRQYTKVNASKGTINKFAATHYIIPS